MQGQSGLKGTQKRLAGANALTIMHLALQGASLCCLTPIGH